VGSLRFASTGMVLGVALACGDDSASGAVETGVPDEVIELSRAIQLANCKQVFACCSERERNGRPAFGATEAECVEAGAAIPLLVQNVYGPALAAGRIAFNADQARACLAALEPASCTASDSRIDCDRYGIWEPRVPAGGVCTWSEECIDGWCDRDFTADEAMGVCIALAADGAICELDRDCRGGNCEFNYPESHCTGLYADGASCNFDLDCASRNCQCPDQAPDRVDCLGATGTCAPPTDNGCVYD
jgi:hypothetical protein